MKKILYCALFACIIAFVFLLRKREHMEDKPIEQRMTELEDEYKQLQAKLDSQEARMGAAARQASDAQAFLSVPVD